MHILAMFIVGLIVGALAKLFMPGRDPGGIIVTMLSASPARSSPGSSGARSAGIAIRRAARASSRRSSAPCCSCSPIA